MSEKIRIAFTLNGEVVNLEVEAEQTLLSVLRDNLGMTGVKEGCSIGECGACTVIVDGKATKSCIALAAAFDGKDIVTIEGLAKGDQLHPIQEAFIEKNAVQCGFCTSGFIMSALAYLEKHPHTDREAIRKAISGNLCRCTGYEQIIDAIEYCANETDEG
jgi:carbon-monoxide dehydrogenase small subunit